jgi:hypothetical protein
VTSIKQIEANRRNSLKSTGPKTEAGKQASRCNAVRHGLTAETVIGALEDAQDYKAFELAITADYDAQSAVGGSWCSDWRACCGGYGGQRPSRGVFSKSRRTISVTLE